MILATATLCQAQQDQTQQTQPQNPSTQNPPQQATPAPAAEKPAASTIKPPGKNETPAVVLNDEDVTSILSQPVFSGSGENMGHIVDVLVDRKSTIRAVVIDFGGFLGVGSRKVAVDWHALRFPDKGKLDHMILSLTRQEVQLAPEFKPGEPIVVLGGSAAGGAGPAAAAAPIPPGK